jgi:transposase InsO family protein
LAAAVRAWEYVYNTVRPRQALGYLTPAEYLVSLKHAV